LKKICGKNNNKKQQENQMSFPWKWERQNISRSIASKAKKLNKGE
jgi:hypothetical protein